MGRLTPLALVTLSHYTDFALHSYNSLCASIVRRTDAQFKKNERSRLMQQNQRYHLFYFSTSSFFLRTPGNISINQNATQQFGQIFGSAMLVVPNVASSC